MGYSDTGTDSYNVVTLTKRLKIKCMNVYNNLNIKLTQPRFQ